jgi:hypothetical protein
VPRKKRAHGGLRERKLCGSRIEDTDGGTMGKPRRDRINSGGKHLKTVCRRMSKNKRSQNGTNPKHDIRGTQKPLAHTGSVAMHGQV